MPADLLSEVKAQETALRTIDPVIPLPKGHAYAR